MKITFLSPFPDMSGGQRVIAIYAQHLAKQGHDVQIACTPRPAFSMRTKIKDLLLRRRLPRHPERGPCHYKLLGVPHTLLDAPASKPFNNKNVPDADVCVATWWETAYHLMKLSPAKGAKAYFMQDYGAPGMEWEKIEPTFRFPVKIITISQWLFDRVRAVNPDADLVLAPNGVELEKFTFGKRDMNRPPVFATFYRGLPTKQSGLALRAFEQYKNAGGTGRLLACGRQQVPEEFLKIPGLETQKPADDDALVRMYQSCDAWLFTSSSEGFGLPILEAMACGTPVIASPAGAAPEIVPQGGGWLIENFGRDTLTQALHELDSISADDWSRRSSEARQAAERYDWSTATGRFEEALLDAHHKKNP